MRVNIEDFTEEAIDKKLNEGGFFKCHYYNDIYDDEGDGVEINSNWYSYDYLESSDNFDFVQCYECGEWLDLNNDCVSYCESGDYHICEDCYNENYFTCDDCDRVFHNDDAINTRNYRTICNDCYSENYFTCEECCEVYENYEACELDGNSYCEDCYSNLSNDNRIYDYHDFDDWQFFKSQKDEGKHPFYVGFELEIQIKNLSYMHDILDEIEEAWPVVFMHDSSIGSNGVEIISHPFTYNYWLENNYKLKKAFDKMTNLGAVSHNTDCCGLHFHFTRPKREEAIERMWLVLETYKDQIVKLSRRSDGQLNHWASFLSAYRDPSDLRPKTLDFIKECLDDCNRYKALNNTNDKTIEFRFFRGTLNYNTFASDYEFLINLYKACTSSKDLCKINWQYLTKSEHIKKYVKDCNIYSKAIVKDESLTIQKQQQKLYKYAKQAFNEVKKQLFDKLANLPKDLEKLNNRIELLNHLTAYLKNIDEYYNSKDLKVKSQTAWYLYTTTKQAFQDLKNIGDNTDLDKLANIVKKLEDLGGE